MTTDASSASTVPASPRKKSFYVEEEEIIIKPSTELIPDEYEHLKNEDVLFHIFRTSTDLEEYLANHLVESMKLINYKLDAENNVHELNKADEFKAELEAIKKECVNKSALVLVFLGFFGTKEGTLLMIDEDDTSKSVPMTDIWNEFTSNNCLELKYKPKIFIFCTSKEQVSTTQTDALRTMDFQKVYDFPAESDILIVYQNEDGFAINKEMFIDQFCDNVTNYSKKYDLIDLISHIHEESYRPIPLIISTLTRKFYLTPSNEREHHLSVVENHYHLEETLQKIHEDIKKLHEVQKKKKEKKFFSFRRKTDDKPKIVDKEKNSTEEPAKVPKIESVAAAPSSSTEPKRSNIVTRSRKNLSETDGSKKKPIWRV